MLESISKLIKKEEIVREEISTVKLLVPFCFEIKDGVCVDPEHQELYDFLAKREDVKEDTEVEENTEVEEDNAGAIQEEYNPYA